MKDTQKLLAYLDGYSGISLLEFYENGGDPDAEVIVATAHARYKEGKLSDWVDWKSKKGRKTADRYFVHGSSQQNDDEKESGPYVIASAEGVAW